MATKKLKKKGDRWIKPAIKRPGELHRKLGVPLGETIPVAKVEQAARSSDKQTADEARMALTLRKLRKRKKGMPPKK